MVCSTYNLYLIVSEKLAQALDNTNSFSSINWESIKCNICQYHPICRLSHIKTNETANPAALSCNPIGEIKTAGQTHCWLCSYSFGSAFKNADLSSASKPQFKAHWVSWLLKERSRPGCQPCSSYVGPLSFTLCLFRYLI